LKQCQDVEGQFVALTYYNGTLIGLKTRRSDSLATILNFFQTFMKNRKPEFKLVKFVVCPPEKARAATVDFAQIYKKSFIQLLKPSLFGKEHPPYLDQLMIFRYEPRNTARAEKVKKLILRRKSVDIFKNLDLNLILREQAVKNPDGVLVTGNTGAVSDKGLGQGTEKPWDPPEMPFQEAQGASVPLQPKTNLIEQNDLKQSEIVENLEKQVEGNRAADANPVPAQSSQIPESKDNLQKSTSEIAASKALVIPPESPFPKTRPSIFKSLMDFKDKIAEPPKESGVLGSLWGKIRDKTPEEVTPIAELPSVVEAEEIVAPDRDFLLNTVAVPKNKRKVSFFDPEAAELTKNEYKIEEEGSQVENGSSLPNEYKVDSGQPTGEAPKESNDYQVAVNSLIGSPNEYSIS
jgi:hypothetical protein